MFILSPHNRPLKIGRILIIILKRISLFPAVVVVVVSGYAFVIVVVIVGVVIGQADVVVVVYIFSRCCRKNRGL